MQEELGILVLVGCPKKLSATLIYHSSDNGIEYFVPLSYFVRNIGNLGRPRFFQATYPSLVNIHHSHMLQKK